MIKGMVVDKEELLKEIKEIRTDLWLLRLNATEVDAKLVGLQKRLSEEPEQKEFQLYDEVRIISVDRDPEATYPGEFLYEVGRITHVDRSVNYPYIVEIDGMKHSTSWLWKAEDLRLIGRA